LIAAPGHVAHIAGVVFIALGTLALAVLLAALLPGAIVVVSGWA